MNVNASSSQPVTGTVLPKGPYHETWYVSVRDPMTFTALELRFSLLVSQNGFRRVAETRAVYFKKVPGRESQKVALKESFDLATYSTAMNREGFQIGGCGLSDRHSSGAVRSKGNSIEWNFKIEAGQAGDFDLIPSGLKKMKLVRNETLSSRPDLLISGTIQVNGETITVERAPGMQTHHCAARASHSGIHGHCNIFRNEQGDVVPFIFEGLSVKNYMVGNIAGPRLSSLYFQYQGRTFAFDSLKDSLRLKSRHSLDEWNFQAERGDLLFKGRAKVEHKDFAGLALDDTNGSLLHLATSKFSDLEIQVYRRGKIENALRSDKSASIEIFSRKKSPYVPTLI